MTQPDGGQLLLVDDRQIELDADGHLARPEQWSPDVGRALADRDGIELGSDHWWLIEFVRRYHHNYGTPPLMRVVVAEMRRKHDDSSLGSREIYRLFSENPVRQACKYGGLSKPAWCI
ncbi:MAG: TusE/DsrC/DsvC family sulfur relay protein [Wenzhouxiangella sp.]